MLRRRRQPQIDTSPAPAAQGFEHLPGESIAMLTWLKANQVEFVLVGPVAEAIHGSSAAAGPVAIVPAPYRRNRERLGRALAAVHAGLRPEGGSAHDHAEPLPAKTTVDLLAAGRRLTFSCGAQCLDVEARPEGAPAYQELLYESGRFELAAGLTVEVASPEDIEHYAHVRRTGAAPEIRITRGAPEKLEHRAG
jgi:hypothetical protein